MNNELMTNSFVNDLENDNNDIFCSFTAEKPEDKKKLYKVMTNPDHKLSDFINKTISVMDIFSENCQLTDGKTGEVKTMPRIVLIDKDGVSYQCVSYGIYNSIKKLIQIYGLPTWEEPIDLLVKQIKAGDKNILSLEIV